MTTQKNFNSRNAKHKKFMLKDINGNNQLMIKCLNNMCDYRADLSPNSCKICEEFFK